jgi:iron(III) transport system permease protein
MKWVALPLRVVGLGLLCGLLALGLAVWPAAVLDRGASRDVRFSVFPLVLTVFDPFVWTCVWNSVLIAGLVTACSLVVGVTLATVGSSRRFRGRSLLWSLALVPLAAGPLLLAPGIGLALATPGGWDWLAARSVIGYSMEDLVRWLALVWVGLAWGGPIVALATSSAIRKIEPVWIDSARATGATRGQTWREIVWPILKPEAARASAAVFTLALIEPAGPLILGLNRTLASQILQSAIRLDQPTRPAALALLAIVLAAIGRTLIGWWGGPSIVESGSLDHPVLEGSSFRRATFSRLILLGWVIFAVSPIACLLLKGFQALQNLEVGPGLGLVRLWLDDPELLSWAANSVTTASLAVLIDLVILSTLLRRSPKSGGWGLSFAASFLQAIPPLALGVGAFAIPWLLEALADSIGGRPGDWTRSLALELNPARSPGFLMILVVAAGKWPMLFRVADLSRRQVQPVLVDASKLMGIPDRRASQAAGSGFVPARVVVLVLALGATNLAPALLLCPFSERRTIAPAIVSSIVREGAIDPRIAAAVLAVLVGKLVAFGLASRTRVGTLGDWYRG